jgi:Ni/Co efflux regulator RcnB
MQKLLSIAIAAAFAAASFGAAAQSKAVTDKAGDAARTKGGQAVTTKDMKDKPKPAPKAAAPAPEKPAKVKTPGSPVTTKSGGPVSGKDQKPVTTK